MSRSDPTEITARLRAVVEECRTQTDVTHLVRDCGAVLAKLVEHEIEADHIGHALNLLGPLLILARLKEVLTGEPGDYESYIEGAEGIASELARRQSEPSDLPNDLPDMLKQILGGNMEGVEIKVAHITRKPKADGGQSGPKTTLN